MAEKHIDKKMTTASMKLYTKDVNSDTIEYWDNNLNKPAIVLIHGFGASTKYQWFKQVELLSENYRVIMPNLFHFGNSKPGTEKYEIEDQVELVHDLLKTLEVRKYIVCGVSYGGLVGIELTNKYPKEVDKMIVFDTPAKFMTTSDIKAVCEKFKVKTIEELFAPENAKGLKKLMHLASGKRTILPAFVFKEFHKEMYGYNLENKRKLITTSIHQMDEFIAREYVIDVPTLLIWGSNDAVVPVARGKQLKNYIGDNSELHILKNGAHMPNLNKTKQFNKILKEFLLQGIK
ncbi:MAG: alpha/beta hydrolase [Crocinitomicaceae bacterium]|nr:alpha/beta hydrolase [Crocinitomicaceae bacterium]